MSRDCNLFFRFCMDVMATCSVFGAKNMWGCLIHMWRKSQAMLGGVGGTPRFSSRRCLHQVESAPHPVAPPRESSVPGRTGHGSFGQVLPVRPNPIRGSGLPQPAPISIISPVVLSRFYPRAPGWPYPSPGWTEVATVIFTTFGSNISA